jgi:two-component sensor histidine kinase
MACLILTQSGAIEWCNTAAGTLLGLQYPRDMGQPMLNLLRWPAFHDYFLAGEFHDPLQLPSATNARQILQIEITTFAGGDFLLFVRDVTRVVQMEQMRRDFVGNVSHELRTPLTVFKGYLDTLSASVDMQDARMAKAMGQMDLQVQRMENLLTDLLWLSRIESVSEERTIEAVDIAAMLEELREELRPSYPDRLVVLDLETRESVTGDYRELRSAVSNLVINAIKYSEEPEPVLVTWSRQPESLLLSVRDNGCGYRGAASAANYRTLLSRRPESQLAHRWERVSGLRSSSTSRRHTGPSCLSTVSPGGGVASRCSFPCCDRYAPRPVLCACSARGAGLLTNGCAERKTHHDRLGYARCADIDLGRDADACAPGCAGAGAGDRLWRRTHGAQRRDRGYRPDEPTHVGLRARGVY